MNLADKIVMRPIEALIPYASNARTHSAAQIDQSEYQGIRLYKPGFDRRETGNHSRPRSDSTVGFWPLASSEWL